MNSLKRGHCHTIEFLLFLYNKVERKLILFFILLTTVSLLAHSNLGAFHRKSFRTRHTCYPSCYHNTPPCYALTPTYKLRTHHPCSLFPHLSSELHTHLFTYFFTQPTLTTRFSATPVCTLHTAHSSSIPTLFSYSDISMSLPKKPPFPLLFS